jgi:hypothetical protein
LRVDTIPVGPHTVSQRRRSAAGILLVVAAVVAEGALGMPAPTGEVGFGETRQVSGSELVQTESVVLRDYSGQPMTALQLTLICEGPYRLLGVERGTAIADSAAWRLFSEARLRRGASAGADTVRVVILSASLAGLGPARDSTLLSVIVQRPTVMAPGAAHARLSIIDVVGALRTGDNAHLHPGQPRHLHAQAP